jgi:hypothetical protein
MNINDTDALCYSLLTNFILGGLLFLSVLRNRLTSTTCSVWRATAYEWKAAAWEWRETAKYRRSAGVTRYDMESEAERAEHPPLFEEFDFTPFFNDLPDQTADDKTN